MASNIYRLTNGLNSLVVYRCGRCHFSVGSLIINQKVTNVVPGIPRIPKEAQGPLYKRIQRGDPGKVIMGFMPVEWQKYFVSKTGVTGFYTFLFTFSTYLVSKEIYILDHEFYNGLGLFTLIYAIKRKVGKDIAQKMDEIVEEYESTFTKSREEAKTNYEECIKHEEKQVWRLEGQRMLVEAKRQNVAMQLEANYRARLMQVYTAVKRRLDYQVRVVDVREQMVHKNIVAWVVHEVQKSLTPEVLDRYFERCIDDLARMIEHHKNTTKV